MDRILRHVNFLKTAASDRRTVGAITMSSGPLIKRVSRLLPAKFSSVIELGPGEGSMTRILLKKLDAKGSLVLVEPNKVFAEKMRNIGDKRVKLLECKAEACFKDALKLLKNKPEIIVASLPFSFLEPAERERLVREIYKALPPQGMCIIFNQYSFLMHGLLKKVFGKAHLSFEVLNMPPCFVMSAKKSIK